MSYELIGRWLGDELSRQSEFNQKLLDKIIWAICHKPYSNIETPKNNKYDAFISETVDDLKIGY